MALYVTVTRGADANDDTIIDSEFLNLLGQPIVEIRGTLDGEGAVSISDGSITTAKLADATGESSGVTLGKLAYMPAYTVRGNGSAISAAPQNLTKAQARELLEVEADDDTLEHSSGTLQVKDAGIVEDKLADLAVTSPKLDMRPPTTITDNEATLTVADGLVFNCEPTNDAIYTLSFAANDDGKSVLVRVKSPGDYTLAFEVSQGLTLRWRTAQPVTPSTVEDQVDLILFTRIGDNVYAAAVHGFEG